MQYYPHRGGSLDSFQFYFAIQILKLRVISQGLPAGFVLSPLLWCLVVEDLIARVNEGGVRTQVYADDIFLLAVGRFPDTVLEHRQWVHHKVEIFWGEVGLLVNPDKTEIVVFTRKRELPCFFDPLFFRVTLHRSVS